MVLSRVVRPVQFPGAVSALKEHSIIMPMARSAFGGSLGMELAQCLLKTANSSFSSLPEATEPKSRSFEADQEGNALLSDFCNQLTSICKPRKCVKSLKRYVPESAKKLVRCVAKALQG